MAPRLVLALVLFLNVQLSLSQDLKSTAHFYTIRLKPHQDLKAELMVFAKENHLKAAFIATCVGSLEKVNLRYANQQNGTQQSGHFEIVSLVGTFNDASAHLHLSVSDSKGKTLGGHLLDGNKICTTAEIVIGELTDDAFTREVDSTYGYNELKVNKRKDE
ncbi:MAG: PPC domain-containing DNA-binding protein [Cytophagales bacterium]